MALNAITTAAFVARGKVYGNLMVDLQATNEKLKARARRIVQTVCACGDDEARDAIERALGGVKLAIAMRKLGIERPEAEARLKKAGGRLRAVIG
jgi:N-acetylmuramic acid 6-phosphate etherase